ncbi:MAG: isoprenylcysteine carboxylmethyltransferase family protein [Xanthobacteraceae bacterium]
MVVGLLVQNALWVIGMGVLLFASAGTLRWPAAWVFLATIAVLGVATSFWLLKIDPALLAERMNVTLQKNQPVTDKIFMLVFASLILIWFIVIGLDHRVNGSDFSIPLQVFGFILLLASLGFSLWVMRTNSFAAPVVKIQAERGHHVISSGPYAWVRHPMYSGALVFFVGMPLMLGSWWGLALIPVFALLFGYRSGIEEQVLIEGLPGYADYRTRVRYRLMPGVW